MAQIKDLNQIAKKFATVTPSRSTEYEAGVKNPKRDWAQAAAAAEDAYKAGVTAAASQGRFGKGVREAGTGKWQQGAMEKGVSRFATGVAMAENAYRDGFAPYHQVIASTTLPPRKARRDPSNLQRVQAIVTALSRAKEAASK